MPFGPSSLMIFEIFLALSWVMPSLRATLIRYSLPDSLGSSGSRVLSDTPRLTSLSLKTSRTALARSSLLARMSTACSPDQAMDAPTPRKSNRVPISLAAWLSALSTSWRSSLDTMSKEDSWDATAPRLDVVGQVVTPNAPRRGSSPAEIRPVPSGPVLGYPSLCRQR